MSKRRKLSDRAANVPRPMKPPSDDEAERREFAAAMAVLSRTDRARYRELRAQMWAGADLQKIGKTDMRN